MTTPETPVGACGDAAPTGDPVTTTRATLARNTDQYLYTSHAHLEQVRLAYRSGRHLEQAITAAERHLNHYKDTP